MPAKRVTIGPPAHHVAKDPGYIVVQENIAAVGPIGRILERRTLGFAEPGELECMPWLRVHISPAHVGTRVYTLALDSGTVKAFTHATISKQSTPAAKSKDDSRNTWGSHTIACQPVILGGALSRH